MDCMVFTRTTPRLFSVKQLALLTVFLWSGAATMALAAIPTVPTTDDTRLRSGEVPDGWTNYSGNCDTSSAEKWGWNFATWHGTPPYTPPNNHDYFISCGSWFESEAAGAPITGLLAGDDYTVVFYVAGFREPGTYGAAEGGSYSVSVGNQSSGGVTVNATGWVEQSFSFTATRETETLIFQGPGGTERPFRMTHFSLAPDSVIAVLSDSDDDGLKDQQETILGTDPNNPDTDADGLSDSIEVNDTRTNPLVADSDDDGLHDGNEVNNTLTNPNHRDTDRDTLTDGDEVRTYYTDPNKADTDGEGLDDGTEVTLLLTNPVNPDTDNDGLRDAAEVNTHSTDPLKRDSDADGLSDGDEITRYFTDPLNPDTDAGGLNDGDEINNGSDPLNNSADDFPDSDKDGVSDIQEAEYDTDPDNPDTDGDGLSDGDELNTTGTNPLTADTDNDGLADNDELSVTLTDPLNDDTDDDGLNDFEETNTYGTDPNNADSDGGGASDGQEIIAGSNPALGADDNIDLDLDDDGIPNIIEGNTDQDNDGIPNLYDLDSDNDGLSDTIEAGGTDTDSDGKIDGWTDLNEDGIDDTVAITPLALPDSDDDGLADYLDLDSDQDGLPDLLESGGTDSDGNGLIDDATDNNNDGLRDTLLQNPLSDIDPDNDGISNRLDLDSDNNGIFDLVQAGGTDTDNNGMIDLYNDADSDQIPDQADVDATGGSDIDRDGIDDIADADLTAGPDVNHNGIDDGFDADPDQDGLAFSLKNERRDGLLNDGTMTEDNETGNAPLRTGVSGTASGCVLQPKGASFDPLFLCILLFAAGFLNHRQDTPAQ